MAIRDDLSAVLARDPRYTYQAYAFVFEALEYARLLKKRSPTRSRRRGGAKVVRHLTGQELCEGARRLALDNFGLMAITVLGLWGLHSTSDIGEVVYNLIASGDLDKTPSDSRSDFDDVFDFEDAFRRGFVIELDDAA